LANVAFIALAYLLRGLGPTVVIGLLLVVAGSMIGFVYFLRQKRRKTFVEQKESQELFKRHKILSLAPESVESE
jgi:hypothetical protein